MDIDGKITRDNLRARAAELEAELDERDILGERLREVATVLGLHLPDADGVYPSWHDIPKRVAKLLEVATRLARDAVDGQRPLPCTDDNCGMLRCDLLRAAMGEK